jgi:hypothetical protein
MIMYGQHSASPDDQLVKMPLDRLHRAIAYPSAQLREQVKHLRLIQAMDPGSFHRLRSELPYFVCGRFHPPTRRRDHFSAARCLVIRLHRFQEAGVDRPALVEMLRADSRLVLAYTAADGDGLHLLFRLRDPCFDTGLYSLFYQAFVQQLADRYELEKVIDLQTPGVTQPFFLSADPAAFFHPQAKDVVLEQVFDPHDPDVQRRVIKRQKGLREQQEPQPQQPDKEPLSDKVLHDIKKKLNPNFKPRKRKGSGQPPELQRFMPRLKEKLKELELELLLAEPIPFGRKLRVGTGDQWAELNLFFGKEGFSVVKTTQTGSHAQLADTVYQILRELMADPPA